MLVLRVMNQRRGSGLLCMLHWGRRWRQRKGLLTCRRLLLLIWLRLRLLRWRLRLLATLAWLLLGKLLGHVCQLLQAEPDLMCITMSACMRCKLTLRERATVSMVPIVADCLQPYARSFQGTSSNNIYLQVSLKYLEAEGTRMLTPLSRIASLPASIAVGGTLRVAILRGSSWPIDKVACSRRRRCPLRRRHHDRGRKRRVAWIAV